MAELNTQDELDTQDEVHQVIYLVTRILPWPEFRVAAKQEMLDWFYYNVRGHRYFYEQDVDGMPIDRISTKIDGKEIFCRVKDTNVFFRDDWEDIPKPDGLEAPMWPPTRLADLIGYPEVDEHCFGCDAAGIRCDCTMKDMVQRLRGAWIRHLKLFPSEGRGIGVFVEEPILKGSLVAQLTGTIQPRTLKFGKGEENWLTSIPIGSSADGETAYINTTRCSSVARFINHSCSPNCQLIEGRWGLTYRGVYVTALGDIPQGKELTIDYGPEWFTGDDHCLCGESNCKNPRGKSDVDTRVADAVDEDSYQENLYDDDQNDKDYRESKRRRL
jgi:hypothetical protein